MKAPRALPNSSASARVSGSAAILRTTSGLLDRVLAAWIAEAATSLPTPDSPRSSTGRSELAAMLIKRRRLLACGDTPAKPATESSTGSTLAGAISGTSSEAGSGASLIQQTTACPKRMATPRSSSLKLSDIEEAFSGPNWVYDVSDTLSN